MTIAGWPWRPDLCPADLHFGEYVEGHLRFDSVIHVGTGLHHHVGLLLGSKDIRVIGLTISQAEVDAWRDLERRPASYTVILRDIRDPNYVQIGTDIGLRDAFTLFHLGETLAAEGQRSDLEVIRFAAARAREVLFYTGSYGFPIIEPVIDELVDCGVFRDPQVWRSLMICKVRHG